MAGTPDLKSLISYHVVVSKCALFLLFAEHFMREFAFRNTSRPRCSLLPHLPSRRGVRFKVLAAGSLPLVAT